MHGSQVSKSESLRQVKSNIAQIMILHDTNIMEVLLRFEGFATFENVTYHLMENSSVGMLRFVFG
jgi:hypothetical protein